MSEPTGDRIHTRLGIVFASLALAGLAALYGFERDAAKPRETSPHAASSANVAATAPPSTTSANVAPPPTHALAMPRASASAPQLADGSADQVRAALDQYLDFARFPPWSRPADDSQKHLWKWNALEPVGQAFSADAKGKKISAQLELDKMFVGAGEPLTATVTVWRGGYDDETREPIDANVVGYVEVWRAGAPGAAAGIAAPRMPGEPPLDGREGFYPVASVSFSADAGGPGKRYVATFTPTSIAALKTQSDVRFVASVDPDGHPYPFSQPFRYAATTALVVLDQHADAIVDGSLQVTLGVDVKVLGPVLVQATLFDASGTTPIAVYDDYYRPTQVGPQSLKITFFGKAIGDKRVDGPYTVRSLHGFVKVPGADPPEVFWDSTATVPTNAYKATDFSPREWDSPEKTDKINQYNRMLSALAKK